jgi:hypothetical protein
LALPRRATQIWPAWPKCFPDVGAVGLVEGLAERGGDDGVPVIRVAILNRFTALGPPLTGRTG